MAEGDRGDGVSGVGFRNNGYGFSIIMSCGICPARPVEGDSQCQMAADTPNLPPCDWLYSSLSDPSESSSLPPSHGDGRAIAT